MMLLQQLTLAACYQLAQSVLKICANRQGGIGEGGRVLARAVHMAAFLGWVCTPVQV